MLLRLLPSWKIKKDINCKFSHLTRCFMFSLDPQLFFLFYLALSAKAQSLFLGLFFMLKSFFLQAFFPKLFSFFYFQAAEKFFTRNFKKFLALSFGCHAGKKCSEHEHVTYSVCFLQHSTKWNAFLVKEKNRWNFFCTRIEHRFSIFSHFRCVKCDECSRLARSRRTRFDCSYFICNCLHCSCDNLSKAFT